MVRLRPLLPTAGSGRAVVMFRPREDLSRRAFLKCAGTGVGALLSSGPLFPVEGLADVGCRTRVVIACDATPIDGPRVTWKTEGRQGLGERDRTRFDVVI